MPHGLLGISIIPDGVHFESRREGKEINGSVVKSWKSGFLTVHRVIFDEPLTIREGDAVEIEMGYEVNMKGDATYKLRYIPGSAAGKQYE